MKRLLTAMVLATLLSSSALAGDIPSLGSPQPQSSSAPGEIPSVPGDVPSVPGEVQSVGWSALLSVLGFLSV